MITKFESAKMTESGTDAMLKYLVCKLGSVVACLGLTAGLALNAQAATSCSGQINYLGIDQLGQVVVANGGSVHTICSIIPSQASQVGYQIVPDACKAFYASLLANRLAGRAVMLYYNSANLTSCGQITPWSIQTSAYFIEQSN